MGWHPESVWTEDITPLAKFQPNPHTYFDPLVMMGVAGAVTEQIRVGVVVTDILTHHPAVLAQTALTLDHVTKGRAILGLGSGEQLNVEPYGMEWDKPVGHLDEALDVIRLLWARRGRRRLRGRSSTTLRDAVLGLSPYTPGGPPIWIAAHKPRMLGITGRKGDGWLPTKMLPERVRRRAREDPRARPSTAGRPEDAVTPGMLAYVDRRPRRGGGRARQAAPARPAALHPAAVGRLPRSSGSSRRSARAGSGFHDFLPTRVGREEALAHRRGDPARGRSTTTRSAARSTRSSSEFAQFHAAGPAAPDPLEHHRVRRSVAGGVLVQGHERDPRAPEGALVIAREIATTARCRTRSAATSTASTARTGTTSGASGTTTRSSRSSAGSASRAGTTILPYYVGALVTNFPVHHDDPYRVHVAGDTVTVEIAFTGETVDGVPIDVRGGRRLHARGRARSAG